MNGRRLDHWTEGPIIVHTGTLSKATEDPTSFIFVEGAINMELVMENPLASDDVSAERTWNEVPRVVGEKGGVLLSIAARQLGSARAL